MTINNVYMCSAIDKFILTKRFGYYDGVYIFYKMRLASRRGTSDMEENYYYHDDLWLHIGAGYIGYRDGVVVANI